MLGKLSIHVLFWACFFISVGFPLPIGADSSCPDFTSQIKPSEYTNIVTPDIDYFQQRKFRFTPGFVRWPLFDYPKKDQTMNGGLPQKLTDESESEYQSRFDLHLEKFSISIEKHIPDPNWNGYAVINQESWWPIWENNIEEYERNDETGKWEIVGPNKYQEASRQKIRFENPTLSDSEVEQRAKEEFEAAAKEWILRTINHAQQLRPNAKWGIYSYVRRHYAGVSPYPEKLKGYNDRMKWFWEAVDAMYPSVYQFYPAETETRKQQNRNYVTEMLREAKRIRSEIGRDNKDADNYLEIMVYTWNQYHSSRKPGDELLNEADLRAMYDITYEEGADGIMHFINGDGTEVAEHYRTMVAPLTQEILGRACPPQDITITHSQNGTVSPSGIFNVPFASDFLLQINPNDGHAINKIMVNGIQQKVKSPFQFKNIQSNKLIHVEFTSAANDSPDIQKSEFRKFINKVDQQESNNVEIKYQLVKTSTVELLILDRKGNVVFSFGEKNKTRGYHQEVWDRRNKNGQEVKSGIYLVSLRIQGETSPPLKQIAIIR